MDKLRAATIELGYQPATTDDEHLDKLRADNERFDRMHPHMAKTVDHYHHTPCPRCGYATRYKHCGPIPCACSQTLSDTF